MNVLQLLNEAADLSSGEKIINAINKGMVPGVKKKVFFDNEKYKGNPKQMDKFYLFLKDNFNQNNLNAAIFLILKKSGTYEKLVPFFVSEYFEDWLDSVKAYFNNRNKQEVKTDPETKKRFEDFANNPFHTPNDKKFEQWVNKKFESKAQIKDEDKEIQVVYPEDKEGWSVSIPKTFAAAKKLACMVNRKAHWCTSASIKMFKSYASKNNPLFIIRNDKKNLMFQMDWGSRSNANFKDEADYAVKISAFMKHNPPKALLKSIKNSKEESLYSKIEKNLESKKDTEERKGKWKEVFSKNLEAIRIVRNAGNFLRIPYQKLSASIGSFTAHDSLETVMGNTSRSYSYSQDIVFKNFSILKNDDQDYFYLVFDGTIRSKKHGVLSNPIVKFNEKGTPVELVSRKELENDIGNIPSKTAKMLSTSENIKSGSELEPILTEKTAKLYKIDNIEDLKDFVRESQEEEITRVAKLLNGNLYLIKFGLSKVLFNSKTGKGYKITTGSINETTMLKQFATLMTKPQLFKKIYDGLEEDNKLKTHVNLFKRDEVLKDDSYYFHRIILNPLRENPKKDFKKYVLDILKAGYKLKTREYATDLGRYITKEITIEKLLVSDNIILTIIKENKEILFSSKTKISSSLKKVEKVALAIKKAGL